MKHKILWKLTACFMAVLLLFTTILGAVFVFMFREHTISINRTAMEEKAVSIAATLAEFESGSVSTTGNGRRQGQGNGKGGGNGYGAYLRFLDELAMAEVWIVDEQLRTLTTSHEHAMAENKTLPENAALLVEKVFQGEITYGEEFSGIMDTPTLTVGAPIKTEKGIIGAVLVHSPASGVDEALHQGMTALGVGAIVALLFACIAAFLLSYGFTSPLRKMKNAALRLADGDYSTKTEVVQRDEIGQLAQTIDLLSEHLAKASEEREALDQLKQDFVANVSHELRTPIAVVRGSLEVLRDGTISTTDEVADYYEQMLKESQHLERLVNDLLDLSRLQNDQFPLNLEEINLCDVVRDTSRSIRMKALEKQIQITTSCPDDACMILADYGRIRQMLLILLDNSVKFSLEHGCVELSLSYQDSLPLLTVTDYGMGIPADETPYIFDRFRRAAHAQNPEGTGLGLAIAKQIADRHGAVISLESSSKLTRFSIRFEDSHPNA